MKMNHISIVETDNQLRQIEVTHHAGFMILPILLPRLRSDSTAPLLHTKNSFPNCCIQPVFLS